MIELSFAPTVIKIKKEDSMSFIWFIIIGIVAGFLAGKIMRGGGFGLVINLLLVFSEEY